MEQGIDRIHAGAVVSEAEPPERRSTPQHGRDTAALWRAIAGMAVSVALACLIVMLEFAGESNRHADRIHRRVQALSARVSRLNGQIASARARAMAANRELQAGQALREILRAPDAVMLALGPAQLQAGAASKAGTSFAGAEKAAAGTLVLSAHEGRGVLIVSGLKPSAAGDNFALWCAGSHGTPIRAARFRAAPDGSALVTFALPAATGVSSAAVVAEESAGAEDSPAAHHSLMGGVVLRSGRSAGGTAAWGGTPSKK